MKSESEIRSNHSINHHHLNHHNSNGNENLNVNASYNNLNASNLNSNPSILSAPKKAAVHDLTQVLIEDCQKIMLECHKLVSKYHTHLLLFANANLNDSAHYRDELKTYRYQSYVYMKTSLDKLLIQMDQVNVNESELSRYIQQIITYLEYLKYEFTRHAYLVKSFSMQSDATAVSVSTAQIRKPSTCPDPSPGHLKSEASEIQKDISELQITVDRLTQKYYLFIPDLADARNLKGEKFTVAGGGSGSKSFMCPLFTKCKFICCFCSPRYI